MTYTTEIRINQNLETFTSKLINTDNLKHWQLGLNDYDYIYGTPSKTGFKIRLHYTLDTKSFFLIQTISKSALPDELHLTYESKGIYTIQENCFTAVSEKESLWVSKNEVIPTTFKMRLMLLIMPSIFKNQTKTYMQNFKNFAENGISINPKK